MVIGFAFGPPNPFLDPQALLKNMKGVLNEMFQGTEHFMYNKKPWVFCFIGTFCWAQTFNFWRVPSVCDLFLLRPETKKVWLVTTANSGTFYSSACSIATCYSATLIVYGLNLHTYLPLTLITDWLWCLYNAYTCFVVVDF